MNVTCPQCSTVYRVDPAKVPARGVTARCARCPGTFPVAREIPTVGEQIGASSVESSRETGDRHEDGGSPAQHAAASEGSASTGSDSAEVGGVEDSAGAGAAGAADLPPAPFGSADPQARARRLARALVSDIAVYNPERRERGLRDGSLRREFRDEIRKSWDEYVAQVGNQMAQETSYFRDALNEILAGGERVF
jgi:predicted Zn finger-like uncharacterized protein